MPGTTAAGVTRVDDVFAHRVAGRCRVLVTQVRYPTGTGATLPLILAVHGADGDPSRLGPLLDVWTQAGYVVAAPTFLKTKKDARGKALTTRGRATGGRRPLRARRAPGPRPRPPHRSTDEVGVAGNVARRDDRVRPDLAHVLPATGVSGPRS